LEDAIIHNEGGDDDGEAEKDEQRFIPKLNMLLSHDKCYYVCHMLFIITNMIVQIILTLWVNKISINQYKYQCYSESVKGSPCAYDSDHSVCDLKQLSSLSKDTDNVTNVTEQYENLFNLFYYVYGIFDVYIIANLALTLYKNFTPEKKE